MPFTKYFLRLYDRTAGLSVQSMLPLARAEGFPLTRISMVQFYPRHAKFTSYIFS